MVLLWVCLCSVNASARTRQLFDADWLFCLDDKIEMAQQTYDDSGWHKLNLPHDWAIEGDFSVNNPSGAGGGALSLIHI